MNNSQMTMKILVPLALDRSFDKQVEYSVHLGRRLKAEIILLHVLLEGEANSSLLKVGQRKDGGQIESTLSTLDKIVESLPEDVVASKIVNVGKSRGLGILDAAALYGVDLIICGVADTSHSLLPYKFSTVLNVMSRSPIPVIARPPHSWSSLRSKTVRVVIADDLSDECISNVKLAMTWCSRIKDCEICHIHVLNVDRESFINSYYTSSALFDVVVMGDYDPGQDYDMQYSKLKERLDGRLTALKLDIPGNGSLYSTYLLAGNVSEQVFEFARGRDADLVFFGKHHAFDRDRLALGRISYRDMLKERFPVLITPTNWIENVQEDRQNLGTTPSAPTLDDYREDLGMQ